MVRVLQAAGIGLLAALTFAVSPKSACAATLSVSPIRVQLDTRHRTSVLKISNTGQENLRMQVRPMSWHMVRDGQWQLTPTDDLVATPELLEIAPGESATLRIGTMDEPGESESAYRLLIDELPNLSETAGPRKPEIKVLTELSLPVYLEPSDARPVPVIRSATVQHGTLMMALGDDGTKRLDAQPVRLDLADSAGRGFAHHSVVANYVLAGSTTYLSTRLAPAECGHLQMVTVGWPGIPGAMQTRPIAKGSDACGGAVSR